MKTMILAIDILLMVDQVSEDPLLIKRFLVKSKKKLVLQE